MWEILLYLLPRHAHPHEIAFHRTRVLRAYNSIAKHFAATGTRDKTLLQNVSKKLRYSMNVLYTGDKKAWKQIDQLHKLLLHRPA